MLYDLPGGPEMRVLQLNTLCSNKREGAYQIGFSPLMRSLPMRPAGKEWPNKADYLFFFYRGGLQMIIHLPIARTPHSPAHGPIISQYSRPNKKEDAVRYIRIIPVSQHSPLPIHFIHAFRSIRNPQYALCPLSGQSATAKQLTGEPSTPPS